jgi:hypothetical protein
MKNINNKYIAIKGKIVSVHAMKVYTGSWGIAPLILNLYALDAW